MGQTMKRRIFTSFFLLFLLSFTSIYSYADEEQHSITDEQLKELISPFTERAYGTKDRIINELISLEHPSILGILKAMLDRELYYIKSNDQLVYITESEESYEASDAVTNEAAGTFESKRKFKSVAINNKLRSTLRGAIASLQLNSKDKNIRLNAARDIMSSPAEDMLPSLNLAIGKERDSDIKSLLIQAKAIIQIKSEDDTVRLAAVNDLAGSLEQESRSALQGILLKDENNEYQEKNEEIRNAADEILNDIEGQVKFYGFIENLFFGLSLGSVLLLAAVGLAITFGVMGVINMAHGEMIMLGAYTTYVIQQIMPNQIGYSLFVAIPSAFIVAGLVGIAIERGVIRFLYGRPLETLLATFGISLILQQAVRTIFSPLNRSVITPDWMAGSWQINGALSITYNRLYIVIFGIAVLLLLMAILKKSRFGLQMRAVTQNRNMARAMGIRSGWVDAMTFGLGSGIAGIAGVALSQLTNVGPNLGQSYIIDSFMVVVFGGVGNLLGTFFAAMSLGVANKFLEPLSGAVLAKIFILVFIIIFIQRRPKGMFALKGRAAED